MRDVRVKTSRNLPVIVLTILLAACLSTFYATRNSATSPKSGAAGQHLVDTSLLETALNLAPLAATPDEQGQAQEAWRLADHELDLTFAAALRKAQAEAEAALTAGGPLRQLSERIAQLNDRVAADKKRVKDLGTDAGGALDLAQAQLDLDQDELDDAQQDLAIRGDGKQAKLQRLLKEHEASEKVADQSIKYRAPGATGTLVDQLQEWLSLREYNRQLQAAAQSAAGHLQMLQDENNALQHQVSSQADAAASVARLRQLSMRQKTLTGLDQRVQDTKQLVTTYQQWKPLVEDRQRAVLHLIQRSLA